MGRSWIRPWEESIGVIFVGSTRIPKIASNWNKTKTNVHLIERVFFEQDTMGSHTNNKEILKPGQVICNHTKQDRDNKFNPADLNYWTPLTDQVEESDQKEGE